MGSKHAIDKETRDRALRAISALSEPDHSLANVPNTIRQSLREVIESLLADRAVELHPKYVASVLGALAAEVGREIDEMTALRKRIEGEREKLEMLPPQLRSET